MQTKYVWLLFLLLGYAANKGMGQVTYPDSCLRIGFYYQDKNATPDTSKTISLKAREVAHFFSSNYSLLNLAVKFTNACDQPISIPSEIRLDMPGQDIFSIEGYRITAGRLDSLEFNMEYDYLSRAGELVLPSRKTKWLKYPFPLGFRVSEKGTFTFRLRFLNEYNYIPVDQWKYYYSNWIYLTIK